MGKDYDYRLSNGKLGVLECPRCFYDENVLKIERPKGIFPGLPNGVDEVMKKHSDLFRGGMMPPMDTVLKGKLWGTVEQISKLRNWQSGLQATVKIGTIVVRLIGAFDDVVHEPEGTYSPYDTKTKGWIPKDDGSQYYQGQMDLYALFLRENGMTPSGKAYLNYWYPVQSDGIAIRFEHALYTLQTDPNRAVALVAKAVKVLTGGQPDGNPACGYCRFAQARVEAAVKVIAQPAAV
jgi:hypothetical protein